MKLRLMDGDGRGEIAFVDVPDDFEFPQAISVTYPGVRLIWGRYILESVPRATYRWSHNVAAETQADLGYLREASA